MTSCLTIPTFRDDTPIELIDYVEGVREEPLLAHNSPPGPTAGLLGSAWQGDEQWLLDLFSSCSDLLLLCDREGRLLAMNPACSRALAVGADDPIGNALESLIHHEDRLHWRRQLELLLASGNGMALRCRLMDNRGATVALEGDLALWRSEQHPARVRLLLRPVATPNPSEAEKLEASNELARQVQERTAELSRSRRLLQEAQRIAQVGSWSLDLRRGELIWSDEIYRIFELDPAQFAPSYDTFLQCVHPDDRCRVDQAYRQSLIDRQPYAVQHRLLMPDGRIKYIAERCETSFSVGGEPLLSIGTALDITAPTTARLQLEANARKLRSLVELAPLGITLVDADGRFLEANPAFCKLTGYSQSELLNLSRSQLWAPASAAIELKQEEELHRIGSSGPYRSQLQRHDGAVVDVKVNALLIEGIETRPMVWSILEDISSSLQVQDALEQAASVFSHALEGIMITGADGTILDVNEALCRITGYQREQLIGSNPRTLKSGIHEPEFYRQMWEQLETTGTWSGEVVNRARDGSLLPMRETISAVRGRRGDVRRYVALLSDIRELKEQQRQLEELALRDPLTQLANRNLLQDRLQQAMHQTRRNGGQLLVALLDLDGFKPVNDQHGHAAGDHLLQTIAVRMRMALRDGDTLARLGGDEFVAVLPTGPQGDQAQLVLERLLQAVREPVLWCDRELRVSGSIGVCRYGGESTIEHSPADLLRQADTAMYEAKRGGRDRIGFSPGIR